MKKSGFLLMATALMAIGCNNNKKNEHSSEEMQTNQQMKDSTESDWTVLFDGQNLDHWKVYNQDSISDQWQIKDSALVFTPSEGEREHSENLITKNEYTDFVLSLEWKISHAGNSGIMWAVQEDTAYHEPYLTGPEIQVLDNKNHPDAKVGERRQAGALYDMVPPKEDVTMPVGEWNKVEITIDHEKNQGTVTMNGTEIEQFPLQGEEWDKMVENSKFKGWEGFAENKTGHIALQDHGNQVSFRNIRIKELNK